MSPVSMLDRLPLVTGLAPAFFGFCNREEWLWFVSSLKATSAAAAAALQPHLSWRIEEEWLWFVSSLKATSAAAAAALQPHLSWRIEEEWKGQKEKC